MRVRTRLPTWLLAGLVFGAAYMFWPFLPWMVLALWLGLYARRVYEPLTRRLGGRTGVSAAITVSLLLLVFLPIAAVVTSIVMDAIALVEQLMKSEEAKAVLVKLVKRSDTPTDVTTAKQAVDDASGVVDLVMNQGDRAWAILSRVAGMAAYAVIGLLIMVTGMYGVLVEGRGWYLWLEKHAPLQPVHFTRFTEAFMETGRGLWWGIVGAGFLQSVIATISYYALGVPSALALGMLTLIFSVIPAIGTAIVWAPVAAGLAMTGRPVAALALTIVGIAVIGTVDNVARPWLAHRGELRLPTWVVLLSMFGGVEVFGGWGLILGPLLVRLAREALEISNEAHDPATSSPPVETTGSS
ncbi:MAG: AI-2E family transporter [Deltaproteobacteria bacterium]|nr:AI-2E family transporter [Deltaproteobacteria bacterium]MDQ3300879.1 AI-2E family transporter [Myxococcota bacterium]